MKNIRIRTKNEKYSNTNKERKTFEYEQNLSRNRDITYRCPVGVPLSTVKHPSSSDVGQSCNLDSNDHISQFVLNGLMSSDRNSECFPFQGVFGGFIQSSLSQSNSSTSDTRTSEVEGSHGIQEPSTRFANHILGRNKDIFKGHTHEYQNTFVPCSTPSFQPKLQVYLVPR